MFNKKSIEYIVSPKEKTIKFNAKDISFDITLMEDEINYNRSIKIPSNFTFTKENTDALKMRHNKKSLFITMFLPTGAIIDHGNKTINIRGISMINGHKAFVLAKSNFDILSIEPILSGFNLYPDNKICGFRITGEEIKYIILLHNKDDTGFKGGARTDKLLISVLKFSKKFSNGELNAYWGMNHRKHITY